MINIPIAIQNSANPHTLLIFHHFRQSSLSIICPSKLIYASSVLIVLFRVQYIHNILLSHGFLFG